MMMLKRWLNKGTNWECLQRCQMHIPSMASQGHYFHVLKNVYISHISF